MTQLFLLLGVEKIRAIDHFDFEGADIILDLNEPISADLAGTAEFICGGSVLDNVFDPAIYIKNIARLLASGGRLIDQNLISVHFHPYLIASPAWYFDYFILNWFADCEVYYKRGLFRISMDWNLTRVTSSSANLAAPALAHPSTSPSSPRSAPSPRAIGCHRKTNIATRLNGPASARIWTESNAAPATTRYSLVRLPWTWPEWRWAGANLSGTSA
jgi:hypothetical protein